MSQQAVACRSTIGRVIHDVRFDNNNGYARRDPRTKCGMWCEHVRFYFAGRKLSPPDVDCMSCLVAEGMPRAR